jgi:hypothetical protein
MLSLAKIPTERPALKTPSTASRKLSPLQNKDRTWENRLHDPKLPLLPALLRLPDFLRKFSSNCGRRKVSRNVGRIVETKEIEPTAQTLDPR